ncbi:MAG TPA: hypothetical protein DCQ06_04920, partial [Myxococcales bacterium]|nr:hypothetical protein [Myxococcales bacterium]
QEVGAAISELSAAQIRSIQAGQSLTLCGEELESEAFVIIQKPIGEGAVASSGDVTVRLDTEVTPVLRGEYLARECVSKIQNLRKDRGLQVEDRIVLSISTTDAELQQAIDTHRDWILTEVLATAMGSVDTESVSASAAGIQFEMNLSLA